MRSILPSSTVRRLLKSCATPPVSCPTASSRWAWRSAASVRSRSSICSAICRLVSSARARAKLFSTSSTSARRLSVASNNNSAPVNPAAANPNDTTIPAPRRHGASTLSEDTEIVTASGSVFSARTAKIRLPAVALSSPPEGEGAACVRWSEARSWPAPIAAS